MGELPPPPPAVAADAGSDATSIATRSALALVTFVIAGVLPSLFLGAAAFDDDPTATGPSSSVWWLIGIELVVAAVMAGVVWAVGSARRVATWVVTALVIVAAGAWGFASGFVGTLMITLERHPTWDDA